MEMLLMLLAVAALGLSLLYMAREERARQSVPLYRARNGKLIQVN